MIGGIPARSSSSSSSSSLSSPSSPGGVHGVLPRVFECASSHGDRAYELQLGCP
jgi:hypothetical protein